ncbi:MAG: twin transmembrane helix small protein [Alphaproteobacteria bacterium]
MESVLTILIPIAMAAVVIVLALGLFNMFRRDAASPSRSNKLMRLRILFQFIAVVLIMLLFYLAS